MTSERPVVLSLEGVTKEFPPPPPMRIRRAFARLGGLQIDGRSGSQIEDDDDDDFDEPVDDAAPELATGGQLVLDDITLQARAGSLITLTGPAGSGKTTLLKLVSGITEPSAGRVVVRGTVAPALTVMSSVMPSRGHNVRSALPQLGAMVGIPPRLVRDAFDAIEELMGVPGILGSYTSTMEAPRKRELVLATALALEPDILVSDYGFRPDSEFSLRCLERAAELRERGSLMIFELANLSKASYTPEEILTLEDGRLV